MSACAAMALPLLVWLADKSLDFGPEGYSLAIFPLLGSFADEKKTGRLTKGLILGLIWIGLYLALLLARADHGNIIWYVLSFVVGLGCALSVIYLTNKKSVDPARNEATENSTEKPDITKSDLLDVAVKIALSSIAGALLVLLVLYCWAGWGRPRFVITVITTVIVSGLSLCVYRLISHRLKGFAGVFGYFLSSLGVPFAVVYHMLDMVVKKIAPQWFSFLFPCLPTFNC